LLSFGNSSDGKLVCGTLAVMMMPKKFKKRLLQFHISRQVSKKT
jgi:hypothetical protein